MDCDRVNEVMFQFLDHELDDDLLPRFRSHVDGCSPCAQRMTYTRKLLLTVRERCGRRRAPDHLRERILTTVFRSGETLH